MAAKLSVGNFIPVPVTLEIPDLPAPKKYSFTLTGKRVQKSSSSTGPQDKADFLLDHITDWHGQTLVVDADTEEPCPFSRENFAVMLDLFGVAEVVWNDYITALVKASGAEGKAKN